VPFSFDITWDAPRLIRALRNRRFEFDKRRQLFIGVHNETLSVVPMRVSNPERSPVGINR
jgi:hypothetical protein